MVTVVDETVSRHGLGVGVGWIGAVTVRVTGVGEGVGVGVGAGGAGAPGTPCPPIGPLRDVGSPHPAEVFGP